MTEIVIPIKNLAYAKQRLSGALSAPERSGLVMAMLEDVLGRLTELDHGRVWVVSCDDHALDMAQMFGAVPLREIRSVGYNAAIITWIRALPDEGNVAIIPGDLPLASETELRDLVAPVAGSTPQIRIAPSHDFEGTNGLFLSSKRLIRPAFGSSSFARHFKLSRAMSIEPDVLNAPMMAHDVDTREDLEFLIQQQPGGATGKFLRDIEPSFEPKKNEDVA